MNPELSGFIRRHKSFFITLAVVLLAFVCYYPYSPAGVQARNMARAREHILVVQRALGSDPRFVDIRFAGFTGDLGSLEVYGQVKKRSDYDRLKEIVSSTSPPTKVRYRVHIEDEITYPQTLPTR